MRGREHSIVLPDATRTAQSSMHRGSRTRCIPLASVMGIEPIGRWVWRPDRPPGRTLYDSFPDYRSANQARGGRTPFAERVVRRVSGSHKPQSSKLKLPGLSCPVTPGAGARRPCSATTYAVGAGAPAGGANFARLFRRLATAVVL